MAVSAKVYGLAQQSLTSGEINWLTDTIKVMLCTATYTPNQDTHRYKSDITAEVTGTGYTAGGVALANKTNAYNTGTNVQKLDADDSSWANSTITARYGIVYKDTGTASTSPLICYVDFDANIATTAGTFSIVWDAAGIVTLTAA